MLWTLHRYVTRQMLRDLPMVGGGVALLLLPGLAMHAVTRMPVSDLELLSRYLLIILAGLAPYLLPIVLLFSITATFGGLVERREWIALQQIGVHPSRALLAPMLLAVALSVALYGLLGWTLPGLQVAKHELLRSTTRRALQSLNPGRSTLHMGGAFLHRERVDAEDPRLLHGVFLHLPPSEENPFRDVFASELRYELEGDALRLRLRDFVIPDPDHHVHIDHEGVLQLDLSLQELFPPPTISRERPAYRTSPELEAWMRERPDDERWSNWRYEWHRRLATAWTPILMTLLGAWAAVRFGHRSRLHGLWAAGGGLLLFYLASNELSKDMARSGVVHPVICAWWYVAIALPLLLYGVRKLDRR